MSNFPGAACRRLAQAIPDAFGIRRCNGAFISPLGQVRRVRFSASRGPFCLRGTAGYHVTPGASSTVTSFPPGFPGGSANFRRHPPRSYRTLFAFFQLVRLLVESGADVYSRNKGGKTPCDVAAPGLMPHLLKCPTFGK